MARVTELPPRVNHSRIPTLDGWRAVAIAAVLCGHIAWPVPGVARIAVYGGYGVQLFFALSGFLITSRLLAEYDRFGRIDWKDFYIRRAFRILPPAFLFLGTLAVLGMGFHLIPVAARQIAACVFFYRNYIFLGGWYTGHFWSLSVEEHFYLLWPAVLALVGAARGARAAVVLAFIAIAWRIADQHMDFVARFQPHLRGADHRTDYCLAQLLWGCFLAYMWRIDSNRQWLTRHVRSYWVVLVIAVQVLLLRYKPEGYQAPLEILVALLPLITISDPKGVVSRVLEWRPVAWIGLISYSLYLWQQIFFPVIWRPIWEYGFSLRGGMQQLLGIVQAFPVNITLAVAAACVSYYFVERPFIQLGKRVARRRRMGLAPGGAEEVSSSFGGERRPFDKILRQDSGD